MHQGREKIVCSVPTGKIDSLIGKPMNALKARYIRYSCRAIHSILGGGGDLLRLRIVFVATPRSNNPCLTTLHVSDSL